MVQESILFDHDRQEWHAWLSCLPRTRNPRIKPSAMLAMERLHLLSFLDDCVRRCMKTPYRYIEEAQALAAQSGSMVDASTFPSPLLFTALEQFQAKLAGHHIASDAADVVIIFLRQLILSMLGKLEADNVRLLAKRLDMCIDAAEAKRETKLESLRCQVGVLQQQIDCFDGKKIASSATVTFKPMEGESH